MDRSPLTVLLVDDDEACRHAFRRMLLRQGHRVLEACFAEEAIAIASAAKVDLLVSDVLLPRVHGPALARMLGLPCILMTGADREDVALPRGARLLLKPFTMDEFCAEVEALALEVQYAA